MKTASAGKLPERSKSVSLKRPAAHARASAAGTETTVALCFMRWTNTEKPPVTGFSPGTMQPRQLKFFHNRLLE
jgi:hypothetical protein